MTDRKTAAVVQGLCVLFFSSEKKSVVADNGFGTMTLMIIKMMAKWRWLAAGKMMIYMYICTDRLFSWLTESIKMLMLFVSIKKTRHTNYQSGKIKRFSIFSLSFRRCYYFLFSPQLHFFLQKRKSQTFFEKTVEEKRRERNWQVIFFLANGFL